MSAEDDVGILESSRQLAGCVEDWVLLGGAVRNVHFEGEVDRTISVFDTGIPTKLECTVH